MTQDYQQYAEYTARYAPRDNSQFVLKEDAREHVGSVLRLMYSGVIDDDRPRYAGDHEFVLAAREPTVKGLPVWFSELDLADIQPP